MLDLDNYRDKWLAEKVDDFIGFYNREFFCLDNFSSFGFKLDGIYYQTVEHAYQSYKFKGVAPDVEKQIIECYSAYDAQKIAHENIDKQVKNWDEIKVDVMEKLVRAKLEQNPYVKKKLLETQDVKICEDSPKDSFWGIGPNRDGRNELGKLWMKLRKELQAEKQNVGQRLYLSVPTKEDMWFKKEMEADLETMDYNAGYNVSFKGFNYYDGTIQEDLVDLQENWLPKWVGHEPNKYFAFVRRIEDDAYIGEVFFKDETENGHEIGILIKGEYRGNGYATEAVKLLCQKADELGIEKLYHQIPDNRKRAIKADLNNGFYIIQENIPCNFTKFGERENETLMIRNKGGKHMK